MFVQENHFTILESKDVIMLICMKKWTIVTVFTLENFVTHF